MQNDLIIAGFGGQGVLLIGKMLAYAGMADGKEVSWLPSYGPEMRGGTCNCTVVIADRPVGSPVVERPWVAMVMNLPSLEKYEEMVKPGGLLLVNTSLINREVRRTDVRVVKVPANEIANRLGNPRAANMVALGAYLGATRAVSLAAVEGLVRETFAGKAKVIDSNLAALQEGYALGEREAADGKVVPQEVGA
ncbi:MAG: 2-oxoacid:ferredoxin oxidoreductase subunit gamma [Acidobacteria bacterium 21-70-11]|nr:MAG: 2-oxoacid:ferredoxin oxidoreductase subunit gamma [Acidobacteria bacterium 21-70-11]OYW05826.1 MAG: 2-oxoacid:ferredoxin oxidoreductase subunit gamma [Acidobacteria bacterium 37-71-11]HQU34435.1 2-oxoacid:acceptor oxidoreductase family protein [Thermoanaerobaculaceae bacterium]